MSFPGFLTLPTAYVTGNISQNMISQHDLQFVDDKFQLHDFTSFHDMIRFANANHFVFNWSKYRQTSFQSILPLLHNLFKGSAGVERIIHDNPFTLLFGNVLFEISFYARHLSFAILKFHIHFTALCRLICQRARAEHRTNTFYSNFRMRKTTRFDIDQKNL